MKCWAFAGQIWILEKGKISIERKFADGQIGDPKSKAPRAKVEMHPTLAAVFIDWRKQTLYAKDGDYVFPSNKLKGKKPRVESMIVQDYMRPAAEKLGLRPEGCTRFGLQNLRQQSSYMAGRVRHSSGCGD